GRAVCARICTLIEMPNPRTPKKIAALLMKWLLAEQLARRVAEESSNTFESRRVGATSDMNNYSSGGDRALLQPQRSRLRSRQLPAYIILPSGRGRKQFPRIDLFQIPIPQFPRRGHVLRIVFRRGLTRTLRFGDRRFRQSIPALEIPDPAAGDD